MRFADEYSGALADPLVRFTAESRSAEERLIAQDWRLTQSTAAYTIASGTNPVINALDMIVLASLSRMVIEDPGVTDLYGDRAIPVLEVHRDLEGRAWALVDGVLEYDHITQLRAVIEEWRANHPKVRAVAQIRFTDFAKATRSRPEDAKRTGGGLFALIGLDPFGSIDPAVREIEQTRQLGERTIFYLQRAPNLLDMQVERLVYQLAVMPETKQALLDIESLSSAGKSLGRFSDQAPQILANERHAIIEQLTAALLSQQAELRAVLTDTRAVLDAGTDTAESIARTVKIVDDLVARVQAQGAARASSGGSGHPFDINEYSNAARSVAQSAQELTGLLVQLDASAGSVEGLVDRTKHDVDELLDRVFWRSIWIILFAAIVLTAAALVYRVIARSLSQESNAR